jgi:hypothetical protein
MRMFQVCVCGQPLQLNEQPTPEPKGTEVLLKVLAAGVCHSDLHLADGWFDLGGGKRMSLADRGMKLPVTLGTKMSARLLPSDRTPRVSRSATAALRIRGSAAAPAAHVSVARKTSAEQCGVSASFPTAVTPTT